MEETGRLGFESPCPHFIYAMKNILDGEGFERSSSEMHKTTSCFVHKKSEIFLSVPKINIFEHESSYSYFIILILLNFDY